MLAGVLGGGLAAQDRTLQRSIAALPISQRSYRIDSFGLPIGKSYRAADRAATTALAGLTPRAPLRATSFRTLIIAGEQVRLVGVDDLPHVAKLLSGRWPTACTPVRCEVVQVGSFGNPVLDQDGINLVRVGIAAVPDHGVFGGSLSTPSPTAQQRRTALLLVGGAGAFEHLPAFEDLFRTYSWIAPVDPGALHIWEVGAVLAGESQVQAALAEDGDTYQLSGPDSALIAARQSGHVAAQRLVLIGGEISALLLGFALVAAIGLRRGVRNESRRLLQRGARRTQIWVAVTAEVAAMTLAGAIAGIALGTVAVLVIAREAGLPAGAILDHSLLTRLAVAVAAGSWIVATAVILAAVASPERRRARGVRLIDIAAIGAAVAIVLGLSTGKATADSLSSTTSERLFFTLLPGLICFVAAVLAGRLLGPAMRLAERAARRAPAALNLALLVLARAPARTVATAGFLIVSVGLALFASSYRATLADGARDEAAFEVPLDLKLTEGTQLVLPLDAAPPTRYDALAPGVHAYPVLRRTASVAGSGATVLSPVVLGLPAGAVAQLHWRHDFSSLSLPSITQRLEASGQAQLRGAPVPPDARSLSMPIEVKGVPVTLALVAETAAGRLLTLPLGDRTAGATTLSVPVPNGGLRQVIGLEISLQANEAHQIAHRNAEGENARAEVGSASLGPLTATGTSGRPTAVTDWKGWLARNGGEIVAGTEPRLTYSFSQLQTVFVRLPQPTDGHPLPVLVSSGVAAAAPPGGLITLNFQDVQLSAQIVGVANRFPDSEDLGGGFAVADESRLETALEADAPGTATPDELWLSVPAGADARVESDLRKPPFASLVLSSRREIQRQLSSEPLARGITITLTSAGLIALLLAAIGFWLTLVSDARDERGELFDLEAQGVPPETLRNQLRARSLVLLCFGGAGGLAVGLILSRLVVSIVRVSAETTSPEPPLLYQPAWSTALLGLAGLALVIGALTELTARRALGGAAPARSSWSLE